MDEKTEYSNRSSTAYSPKAPERVKGNKHVGIEYIAALCPSQMRKGSIQLAFAEDTSLKQRMLVNLIPCHTGVCRRVCNETARCLIWGQKIACFKAS